MAIAANDILNQLPHREPFRFLSRVDELTPGKTGIGTWQVDGGEDFFKGHFPGQPLVPGVLITEALAQISGIVGFADRDSAGRPGMLVQMQVRLKRAVQPPADIQLESTVAREMGRLVQFDVVARHEGAVIAQGQLTLAEGEQ